MAVALYFFINGPSILSPLENEGIDTLLYWSLPLLLLILLAMMGLALLAAGIGRLLHERPRFVSLFCLLVFADVPWLLMTGFIWWARQNWMAYRISQVLNLIVLWWTTTLLYQGLRLSYRLSWWKAGLVALPGLLFTWSWTLWFVFGTPPAMKAALPWERAEGQKVTIYYPTDKSPEEVAEIVRGCDRILEPIYRKLEVEPLPFKVDLFLFPDDRVHRWVVGGEDPEGTAYAHDRAISTVYDVWPLIHCTVAHELTHVVIEQQIARDLPSFLNEGLATYVQFSVARSAYELEGETPPRRRTQIPLRTLVRGTVFWDREQAVEMGGHGRAHYDHAAAFVQYLIERYGLDRMKQLCQEWAQATRPVFFPEDESPSFVRIFEKVYGLPLNEVEDRWRKGK
jgi:hypothetical protein